MNKPLCCAFHCQILIFIGIAILPAAEFPLPGKATNTPIRAELFDADSFAEWDGGREQKVQDPNGASRGPGWVIWTTNSKPGHSGIAFGTSKTPGLRHLRIGFTETIPVGTVLTRGNIRVSALKADAGYPAKLDNDDAWTPGQRLAGNAVTTAQAERDEYALWVFPAGTTARALRFSHEAEPADPVYDGWLGGAVVLQERLINLAAQAIPAASADQKHANLLNNGLRDGWGSWQNVEENSPSLETLPLVSAEQAEWILLTWAEPVDLDGVAALWAGFGAAEIQAYRCPDERHPRDASSQDWETVKSVAGFECGYPVSLWPNVFAFDETVQTRALRLRMTAVTPVNHPHVQRRPADGKRVWLGELMALQDLGDGAIAAPSVEQVSVEGPHPPIPIRFNLPEAGYVTLVIEDSTGKRVRNLVSETRFPAGDNTAWWDGTHDLDRDLGAANHGLYSIPARFVEPGKYTARGLWRKEIEAFYEFSAYNSGNPPWPLPDHTGGWLANHSAPSAAVFVPATHSPTGEPSVFLGSYITEGPDGFAWVDLDGTKRGGMKWIGGNWTAAPHLGRDTGPEADANIAAYVASPWETGKGTGIMELRVSALELGSGNQLNARQVYKGILEGEPEEAFEHKLESVGGITAHNGIIACALRFSNRILRIDAASGEILGELNVDNPRGIKFSPDGRLFVISENRVLQLDGDKSTTVVSNGLEDPLGLTLDAEGRIYVSDHGDSHQVKVFSPDGKLVREIGKPGKPKAGPYEPHHMNHPAGLAIDSKNQLWVTEHDYTPKRVSVWTLDGKLVNAVYGPAKYGGGGMLDPRDKSKFYYADEHRGTLEFRLDWEKGTSELTNILFRTGPDTLPLNTRICAPETAIYHEGRRYFTNCYNSSPTNGSSNVLVFLDRDNVAQPVAGMGVANDWPMLLEERFHPSWPEGTTPSQDRGRDGINQAMYLWMDQNGDALMQPEEIEMTRAPARGFTVMPDLSFCVAQVDGERALRFRPTGFSKTGVPAYDLKAGEVLTEGVQSPKSTGGAQVLADDSDEVIITLGVEPFHSHSICGTKAGKPVWSYPNPWPGLHASHHAAKPDAPGQLIGPTRLMGGFIEPKGAEVGPLFALNANMGNFYLFTRDGLFVSTVFADSRLGKAWKMPVAERNMSLEGLTLHDENFWPSINQTPDGRIYLLDGSNTSLLRLDGLESLRPISRMSIDVTTRDLQDSQRFVEEREAARQKAFGSGILHAAIRETPPNLDGKLDDWTTAEWVEIDRRGDGANFNSNSKPYHIQGAIAADETHLYAAWDTRDGKLLQNSGEIPNTLFKTGGALDLMLATDPAADPKRQQPAEGDLRLLITQVDGETRALLYRAVVSGTGEAAKIPFVSPVWSLTFDRVDDVSDQVQLAANESGNYEISIPLSVLGLNPKPGLKLKGDIGILRGEGFRTTARSYWSNKATAITADVPSEAKLSPHLWGTIEWE